MLTALLVFFTLYYFIYIKSKLIKKKIIFKILLCAGSLLLHGLFSGCGEQGLRFSCSVQVSHCGGFSCCGARAVRCAGLSSCSTWALRAQAQQLWWAQLLCSMWGLPGSGVEPVSSALAGGHCTTEPAGKSRKLIFKKKNIYFQFAVLGLTCDMWDLVP